jgi:hypothetical protein
MKTPLDSRASRKPPSNENLYGGRLSIARVGISVTVVLVTLVIALTQGGGGPNVPKSSTPGPLASGMQLP